MKTHKWSDVKKASKIPAARIKEIEDEVAAEVMAMNLAQIREAAGLTQVELATKLKVVQSGIARVEGQNDPRLSTLRRYVHALGGEVTVLAKVNGKTVELIV